MTITIYIPILLFLDILINKVFFFSFSSIELQYACLFNNSDTINKSFYTTIKKRSNVSDYSYPNFFFYFFFCNLML